MSSYQLFSIESVDERVQSASKSTYYQSKLDYFKKINLLFQLIEPNKQPGLFIYNALTGVIEYADSIFLNSHQILKDQLNHSVIRRLLMWRLEQSEINKLNKLEHQARLPSDDGYVSTTVYFRDSTGSQHQYYIQMLRCSDLIANEHLRIGIQFKMTVGGQDESVDSHFYMDCKQRLLCLSNRELQVVSCIVKGDTDTMIAEKLCISIYTAKKHRKNILKKLKLKNTALLAYMVGKVNLF